MKSKYFLRKETTITEFGSFYHLRHRLIKLKSVLFIGKKFLVQSLMGGCTWVPENFGVIGLRTIVNILIINGSVCHTGEPYMTLPNECRRIVIQENRLISQFISNGISKVIQTYTTTDFCIPPINYTIMFGRTPQQNELE